MQNVNTREDINELMERIFASNDREETEGLIFKLGEHIFREEIEDSNDFGDFMHKTAMHYINDRLPAIGDRSCDGSN